MGPQQKPRVAVDGGGVTRKDAAELSARSRRPQTGVAPEDEPAEREDRPADVATVRTSSVAQETLFWAAAPGQAGDE